MNVENYILKFAGAAIPSLVRWRFPKTRFEKLIDVAVPSNNGGFRYNALTQEAECWIEITNRSPFDIIADRITMRVMMANKSGCIFSLMPCSIASATKEKLIVSGLFLRPELDALREAARERKVVLSAEIAFNSQFRNFVTKREFDRMGNVDIMNILDK